MFTKYTEATKKTRCSALPGITAEHAEFVTRTAGTTAVAPLSWEEAASLAPADTREQLENGADLKAWTKHRNQIVRALKAKADLPEGHSIKSRTTPDGFEFWCGPATARTSKKTT
jgi:hypothetical protein